VFGRVAAGKVSFDKEGEVQITIPRWAQAVLIPVAIFLALYFAKVASHAVFVFLVAIVVAVLLNPVVLGMGRIKVPRWAAVPIVYLAFVAVIVIVFILLGPALVGQFQRLFEAIPGWLTDFNGLLADLQAWLASNNVQVNLQINTTDIVDWLESNGARSVGTLFSLGVSVAGMVVNIFLTVVVSFYMLIDGKRIFRFLCRLAPGTPEVKNEYVRGLQTAFSRFVRGQALLAATIGLACGLAIWILSWDVVGVWPDGGQYALLFGFWAGVTEIIPYIGPWIGAVPPVIAAFFYSPTAALVVIIVYFAIQQLESHILAPNIVGSSVGGSPAGGDLRPACGRSDRRYRGDHRVPAAPCDAAAHPAVLQTPGLLRALGHGRRYRSHPGTLGSTSPTPGQTPRRPGGGGLRIPSCFLRDSLARGVRRCAAGRRAIRRAAQ
jgi:predicted PurR-regulated permease PerM